MPLTLDTPSVLDPALEPIREKIFAGQRLSHADGVALFRSRDIFTVGELANIVRERLHGRRAYYNINRHINYTNYCVLRCKFCSFYRPYPKTETQPRDSGDAHSIQNPKSEIENPAESSPQAPIANSNLAWANNAGYELTVEQVADIAAQAQQAGATEVHIVGGLHPRLPFSYYTDMCREIKRRCPGLHIKAFTAIEIVHFTRISKPRLSIEEVLIALRDAGLDSMPGGGAEIFDDRVHDEAFKAKVGEKHWFDVHRAAHDLGIPTNATMLYGHIESVEERVTHLVKLREHQEESLRRVASKELRVSSEADSTPDGAPAGDRKLATLNSLLDTHDSRRARLPAAFQCCIPLSFIPDGSEFSHLPGPTGLDDLRTLAVARLMLDNIPHIKAFWIMQTPKLSQVALNWGVDDFDGTVVWYDITKREGRGTNHQELTVEQISGLIREAGCIPVERDTLYRTVRR